MLNPGNDRLDYGHILAAPAGYELDFAVGTTYSLDLDALVGASFALGLSEETDSELMNNPVCLLEALRSIGDKIALFCEGGQIHLPSRTTPLYIMLEKVVFSVKTAKRRGLAAFPSFHPKLWLIRYASKDGEDLYRVIVLSRNLTFDRSWDVSFYMDGSVQDTATDKNQPLCDFLQYLIGRIPSDDNGKRKARAIRAMIKALPYVAFDTADRAFYDYEFIPNGIKREDGGYYRFEETHLFKDTFHETLIISPFVSGGVIRSFNDRNIWTLIKDARYLLITRETSLARLKPEDVSRFRIFTLRDTVIDGETAISESAEQSKKQDIHAKIYMSRKYADTDLYLGSLNASHNAVYGNVEFILASGIDRDSALVQQIHRQMMSALDMRTTIYAVDTFRSFQKRMLHEKERPTNIRTHFAVAFTKGENKETDTDRKKVLRNAFNAPFRPFVLATTSIGQEGLDFHNYCRRIVHWNLPSNPIDLEQREGRINRFECLTVRQNVAKRYGTIPFEKDVWEEMFAGAVRREKTAGSSDLIPYWGLRESEDMLKIERIVPMYPFSRDGLAYERLIRILSLYRLTLGQARQEELLEYLFKNCEDPDKLKELFINLSPFYREHRGSEGQSISFRETTQN